jgi:hypothetical protein
MLKSQPSTEVYKRHRNRDFPADKFREHFPKATLAAHPPVTLQWTLHDRLYRQTRGFIMSDLLTPQKANHGWVITMTPEMAEEAGVVAGSFLVFYLDKGGVSTEILPPATDQMKRSVQESINKFGDAFGEMKRLGD